MELFMMDRHQLQQAAALVIMLDIHPFRHTSTARSRRQARDEQQQQRGGRREGLTHHGRAHVLAPGTVGSCRGGVSATVSSVTGVPKCVSSRPDRAVLVDSLVIVSMFTTPYGESRSASEAAAALEAKAEAAAAVRPECILRPQPPPTACTPCCPKPQPRPVAVRCAPRNAAPT